MIPRASLRGRFWMVAILAFLLASATALAGTTGNLTGYVTGSNNAAVQGVKVSVTGPTLQGARSATTDKQGFFRLTQLPPGDGYRVRFEANGYKTTERSGVVISIDTTIKLPTVNLKPVQVSEAIEVVEEAPTVDQGSTSIGRTMDSDFLDAVPTGRNTTAVLTLAPGAAVDSYGVSFRGATSPENSYVIDGLNTTGVIYGLDSSALPPEFIQEIQVKTGGYEPEYGRATGGQSIVITKSGGNEFHGDVFAYITPFEGRRHTTVAGFDNLATGARREASIFRQDHLSLQAQVGFDVGGYVIKDRLWFFVGYAPSMTTREINWQYRQMDTTEFSNFLAGDGELVDPDIGSNGAWNQEKRTTQSHYYIANFTYNLNQDHSVRFSTSGNPGSVSGMLGSTASTPSSYMGKNSFGAADFVMTYNGKFASGLANLDLIVGYHTEKDKDTPISGDASDPFWDVRVTHATGGYALPTIEGVDTGTCVNAAGTPEPCYLSSFSTGGYGVVGNTSANRLTVKPILSLFLNNMVGNHVIKLGGDMERNHAKDNRGYTGNALVTERAAYWQERYYIEGFDENGNPLLVKGLYEDGTTRLFESETITSNVSAFAQDSWSVLSNLTLNLGIRWERQALKDVDGVTRLAINDNIAPRLGLLFDFTKQGKSKLFANYGRYYESIPQDMNSRALAPEGFAFYRFDKGTYDYAEGELAAQAEMGPYNGTYGYQAILGGEQASIQKGLKGMYNDQVLLGFEYEVAPNISVGITGFLGKLGNVVEDISPDNGATYFIANPGQEDITFYYVDENGDSQVADATFKRCFAGIDPMSGAPVTFCFPTPERTYRSIELQFQKRFNDNWTAQGSYTLSQTFGNYPGLFTQSNLQLDPNITSQFDLAGVMTNRYGYLEQDRRHVIKLAGAYVLPFGTSVGLNANVQSGTPFGPLGIDADYWGKEVYMIPRGTWPSDTQLDALNAEAPLKCDTDGDGVANETCDNPLVRSNPRLPWLVGLNLSAGHEIKFANKKSLSLDVQVNNVLGPLAQGTAVTWDDLYVNSVTQDVAVAAPGSTDLTQVQCYDLANGPWGAKNACNPNPTFGNPTSYPSPMSVELSAKFSF